MNLPLIWSLMSIAVHMLGMIGFRVGVPSQSMERVGSAKSRRVIELLESDDWRRVVLGRGSMIGEILLWPASVAGIVHMMFGVLVLSSLLFVSAVDAIPVLIRYAVSAITCQAIVVLILASMQLDLADQQSR